MPSPRAWSPARRGRIPRSSLRPRRLLRLAAPRLGGGRGRRCRDGAAVLPARPRRAEDERAMSAVPAPGAADRAARRARSRRRGRDRARRSTSFPGRSATSAIRWRPATAAGRVTRGRRPRRLRGDDARRERGPSPQSEHRRAACQRRGYGRQLLEHLLGVARGYGRTCSSSKCGRPIRPARGPLSAYGFEQVGVRHGLLPGARRARGRAAPEPVAVTRAPAR